MSNPLDTQGPDTAAKVERPHEQFEHPSEVVTDPLLSKDEKVHALDALEQDARQLSVAAAEGMPAGAASGLEEVLLAKESLELRAKLQETEQTETHATIARAIEAVEAARSAIERDAPATPRVPAAHG